MIYTEDIDVQDTESQTNDTEDGSELEAGFSGLRSVPSSATDSKSSPVQHKSSGGTSKGPLKSIMKKRDKIQRKESDTITASKRSSHFKDFLDLHVSKSPSHSVSMSGMSSAGSAAAADSNNSSGQHVVDAGSVHVNFMRSNTASNRQSLDADPVVRNGASRSSVVATSDSMDDTMFGRGHAQIRNQDADGSMDSEADRDEDNEENLDNDDDRFDNPVMTQL